MSLAIRGHKTRGDEVIKICEMFGCVNKYNLNGADHDWYIIFHNNAVIQHSEFIISETGFTLEEFLNKFPFKVGDRVMIPDYESELRINAAWWDGFTVLYRLDLADGPEWFTCAELIEWNEHFNPDPIQENIHQRKTISDLKVGDIVHKLWHDYIDVLKVVDIKPYEDPSVSSETLYTVEFSDDKGTLSSIRTSGNVDTIITKDHESYYYTNVEDVRNYILNKIDILNTQIDKINGQH